MAARTGTSKGVKGKKPAQKKASSQLRAGAHAAPVPEPLLSGGSGRDIAGVALAVFAVCSFIAVIAPASAPITAAVAGFYHLGFGLGAYVLPLALLLVAALLFVRSEDVLKVKTCLGSLIIFIAVIALITLVGTPEHMVLGVTVGEAELSATGGYLGFAVASVLASALGKPIAGVVLVGIAIAGAILVGFSVSSFIGAVRDHAERIRERRHVEVNERPWGDDSALDARVNPYAPRGGAAVVEPVPLDGEGAAETTFLGDRAQTTLLSCEADDVDEDPFVDLTDALAKERAQTTLIPIEDRYANTADIQKEEALQSLDEATGSKLAEESIDAVPEAPASASESGLVIPEFLKHPHGKEIAVADEDASHDEALAHQVAASAVPSRKSELEPSASDAEGAERRLPPASMLRHSPQAKGSSAANTELQQTAESLQATLQEFGLHSRVVGWISGPTVTTFKVQPGEGERVSRIASLEDDIALSLATDSVRIFAPIPGTSLVGIEIPNRSRQTVAFGDILPYVTGGPLEFALGRDSEGEPMVADLAKMPHLLIAGTTGSGKSVVISSILMSLLMRTFPEDVRLIMIDPKRVEFAPYDGLPHLYVPVVTEPKQAASALQWAVSEMERRLKIFERIGVRKISTFNEKQAAGEFEKYDNPPSKMPYLVIVIDELSDLMMVAGKDVEASIVRIAQLGRAAGIHMIVATQRPSSNVVTGLIKANITNRIGLTVATGIDSRVILDQTGAEKLIGQGDMLFSRVDWGKPKRIQGCFVSDEEIFSVVEFVKEQSPAEYHEEILSAVAPAAMQGSGSGSGGASADDPLIWEAAHLVVESKLGSTSSLQRRLKVGYARAGRIMDMLEEKGIVGPPDGSKPREVLLDEQALEELQNLEAQISEDDGLGGF
ncbi:DNA translocase FtsK 4TM domain-containing protein [uncultured Enorma sp.]|uniref:FtsK/SpoIIIE family DNA translocase n=1 Tax=uncultured Enorma sp. TaxID=1714346 RepID=UPI002804622A|nr:DNA translocase FtsK 4TM domain-containing protein [uncultured Enorma sp.]